MEEHPQRIYNNCHIFESGSINIEHVEHFHQAGEKQKVQQMPAVLQTERAQALLEKARQAGWLNEELLPSVNKTHAAILAARIGRILDLNPLWKPFEELWGMENLSKIYSAGMERKGSNKRIDEIDKVLK